MTRRTWAVVLAGLCPVAAPRAKASGVTVDNLTVHRSEFNDNLSGMAPTSRPGA